VALERHHSTDVLQQYAVSHKELEQQKLSIRELVSHITAGIVFEEDTTRYFKAKLKPLIKPLIKWIQKLYGKTAICKATKDCVQDLITRLETIKPLILSDIESALANDPATNDPLEVVLCYPGFKAICHHRIAHCLYMENIPLLPRMISELAHEDTGIDIHPGAQIQSNFFIDHGTGVVIGQTAIIGKNVTIYQGVTLGAKRFERHENGLIVKGKPRHPIIENHVTIYAGATVLGRITIGENSVIGGNVWVTKSVPPQSIISQQPYRKPTDT